MARDTGVPAVPGPSGGAGHHEARALSSVRALTGRPPAGTDAVLVLDLTATFAAVVVRVGGRTAGELLRSSPVLPGADAVVEALASGLLRQRGTTQPVAGGSGASSERLRADCRRALAEMATHAGRSVRIAGPQGEVTLTRSDVESVLRPALEALLEAGDAALATAHVDPRSLAGVMPIGRFARDPLVAAAAGQRWGLPLLLAAPAPTRTAATAVPPPPPPEPPPPPVLGRRRSRARGVLIAVAGLVVVASLALVAGRAHHRTVGERVAPAAATSSPSTSSASSTRASSTRPSAAVAVAVPTVVRHLTVGAGPVSVAASASGRQLYVADRDARKISVVDTAKDAVTASITIPDGPPRYLALSPDGRRLYVSVWDDARTVQDVDVVDTARRTVVATIGMASRPYRLAVSPDGAQVWVPEHDSSALEVIVTATNSLSGGPIAVPANPHWVSFTPDGKLAWVADHESNVVTAVDTATRTVVHRVAVGRSPHSVAVSSTKPWVAEVNVDAASMEVLDSGTGARVAGPITVGTDPQDVAWSADGRFAYVVDHGSDALSVVDTTSWTVTATLALGKGPTSIAVLPDGSRAYVTNADDATVSDVRLTR